ncbi:hypothetical protein MMC27_002952 [Xylographa pallens]|nr:hypothetical protein [Xylographa pallens]
MRRSTILRTPGTPYRKRALPVEDGPFLHHPALTRVPDERDSQPAYLSLIIEQPIRSSTFPPAFRSGSRVWSGGGEEVMPELRETMLFARWESENEEDRELWRWALGEEEWERWEMLRVEEGRERGKGVW